MHRILKNLHDMPGVIGGLVADANGVLLMHSFPALFDTSALQEVCADVSNGMVGMQDATGGVKLLDLRFEHGRVIIRQQPTYVLLLLCEQTINLQLLQISMNVAVKNLDPLVAQQAALPSGPPHGAGTQPAAAKQPATTDTKSHMEKMMQPQMPFS